MSLLSIKALTKRFGGLVAVKSVVLRCGSGIDRRTDRAEWRGQDHGF